MLRKTLSLITPILVLVVLSAPAAAQLGLPDLGRTAGSAVGGITDRAGAVAGQLGDGLEQALPLDAVRRLAKDRLQRLGRFMRSNRDSVERDDRGNPARRGVVLMLDGDAQALAMASTLGFETIGKADFGNLGLTSIELRAPRGMSLADALEALRKALPETTLSADQIHFPSGNLGHAAASVATVPVAGASIRTAVGLIDGGVAPAIALAGSRGFVPGAPRASDHGTAVASLLHHAGARAIYAADVYGTAAAGGSALAIVRALDWMVGEHVPVVTISLTGPANPLLGRAVAAADARGTVIVAAAGNDGPAAPPAYPASYAGVLAVTGVDARNRALIEAGKPAHLDYAAPGADMKALDAKGRLKPVRGTSFAAPLVAARAAAQMDAGKTGTVLRGALDAEARDLGRKGEDPVYGRGLLCEACRHQ